jgi:hypothetical protein
LRVGDQRPRLCHIPEYVSSSADEVVALAGMAGLVLDDWQDFVLRNALGELPNGSWASSTVCLIVGRQNGKNAVVEARELAGLFLFEHERTIIHSAHEAKTATLQYDRLLARIKQSPDLWAEVESAPRGKGSEAIILRNGKRILFIPRTGQGGLGFTTDMIVYDEAHILSEQDRSALAPTMAARSMLGNLQTWYTASAGDQLNPRHRPLVLARIRESGMQRARGVALFEWSVPGDDPARVGEGAADRDLWPLANPGLNLRISEDRVEQERTVEMGPREFAVERLGVGDWPDTSEDAGRVISAAVWGLCAERDRENRITSGLTYAVDVNPDRTWASVAVAGERDDGLFQVAVVDHRRGTSWVASFCAGLLGGSAQFVLDAGGPAAPLLPELEAAGVYPTLLDGRDYGDACAQFYDATDRQELRYPFPQPDLDEALAAGRRKGFGDLWKWARRSATSADITPLCAVTVALWGARMLGAPTVWDLNEVAAQLRAAGNGEVLGDMAEAASVSSPAAGTRFVALDDMPSHGRY